MKAGKRRRAPYYRQLQFPQVRSEQREPVHVATVPEIMHSMSGMAPDDNLRQIAEAQVEM